jgi:hypothetical protein
MLWVHSIPIADTFGFKRGSNDAQIGITLELGEKEDARK